MASIYRSGRRDFAEPVASFLRRQTKTMSAIEGVDPDRAAGITDPAWWHWFGEEFIGVDDPWREWLRVVRRPSASPLVQWLEYAPSYLSRPRVRSHPPMSMMAPSTTNHLGLSSLADESSTYRAAQIRIGSATVFVVSPSTSAYPPNSDVGPLTGVARQRGPKTVLRRA